MSRGSAPSWVRGRLTPARRSRTNGSTVDSASLATWKIQVPENSGPEGKSTELRIITYDPDAKTYSEYRITSTGPGGTLTRGGTVSGNTEVWPLDAAECGESGESAKCRFTIVHDTPTSFHAKLEGSKGDGPWTVTFATKGVKIK